jgi:hypothetical protein
MRARRVGRTWFVAGVVVAVTACGRTGTASSSASTASPAHATPPPHVRTVTITDAITIWSEDGTSSTAPAMDVATLAIDALCPDGQGGTTTLPARWNGSAWTIPSVPVGPYTLRVTGSDGIPTFLQVAGNRIDLGHDTALREGLVTPTQGTPVTFELSGLVSPESQADPSGIEIFSWPTALLMETGSYDPTYATDLYAPNNDEGYSFGLIVPSDRVYVTERIRRDLGGGTYLRSAVAAGSTTGVTMTDGVSVTIPVSLSTDALSLQGAFTLDWRVTEFAAQLAAVGADAQLLFWASPFYFDVVAAPIAPGVSYRIGSTPDMLWITADGSRDVYLEGVQYDKYVPSTWRDGYLSGLAAVIPRIAPGATRPRWFTGGVYRHDPVIPSPVVPVVTPVQGVTVAGLDASQPNANVGVTPEIAWNPPAKGVPDSYGLHLYRLTSTATGRTAASFVAHILTDRLSVRVPADLLTQGDTYVALIYARQGMGTPASPYQATDTAADATYFTQTFIP